MIDHRRCSWRNAAGVRCELVSGHTADHFPAEVPRFTDVQKFADVLAEMTNEIARLQNEIARLERELKELKRTK